MWSRCVVRIWNISQKQSGLCTLEQSTAPVCSRYLESLFKVTFFGIVWPIVRSETFDSEMYEK